jgi:hypothetical protein
MQTNEVFRKQLATEAVTGKRKASSGEDDGDVQMEVVEVSVEEAQLRARHAAVHDGRCIDLTDEVKAEPAQPAEVRA